jgi:hypothetical protein
VVGKKMILSEVVDFFEASLEGLDGLDVKIGVSDSRMSARAELSSPG